MEAGRIVEEGTHDSLLADGKIYAMLVRRQTGGGAGADPSGGGQPANASLQVKPCS